MEKPSLPEPLRKSLDRLKVVTPADISREGKEVTFHEIGDLLYDLTRLMVWLDDFPEFFSRLAPERQRAFSDYVEQTAEVVRQITSFSAVHATDIPRFREEIQQRARGLRDGFEKSYGFALKLHIALEQSAEALREAKRVDETINARLEPKTAEANKLVSEVLVEITKAGTESVSQAVQDLNERVKEAVLKAQLDAGSLITTAKALEAKRDEALDALQAKSREADEVLKSIREAAGMGGAAKFAEIFEKAAQESKEAALGWLVAAGVFALAAGVALVLTYFQTQRDVMNPAIELARIWPVLLAKALGLSFLTAIVVALVRNYNARMHAYALNEHRANCLKTFRAFANATTNAQTREALLLAAGNAIFQAGDTGYVRPGEAGAPGLDMVRIVEQASGSKPGG